VRFRTLRLGRENDREKRRADRWQGRRIRFGSQTNSEGWFDAEVEVQCDSWRGKIRASFMRGELARFAEEIRILHEKLTGEARLEPLAPYLTLSFSGDGKGHVKVGGTAVNHLGSGAKLSFWR